MLVLAVCVVVRINWRPELRPRAGDQPPAHAGQQRAAARRRDEEHKLQIVAIVNGERIDRNDLAREASTITAAKFSTR